jgi:hypothetical protein
MSNIVEPEKLLKDLAKLWVDLGKADEGVLRSCAMTLIVTVDGDEDAQSAGETIARLMHQHPSRVIVLRGSDQEPDGLEGRVFAQCWMPFGKRQQICCEQIEITASHERLDDLPKLVLGLIAPDLPVVLWCRSERLAHDCAFQQLFPLTEKIIIDSAGFGDEPAALNFVRLQNQNGRNVGDLTWTRLTAVRELVAQIFENREAFAHLNDLKRVEIGYVGPTAAQPDSPSCLQYLVRWFESTIPIEVAQILVESQPRYEIRSIRMEGPGLQARIEVTDSSADISLNELTRRASLPKRGDCDLLREELAVLGIDPIYRRSLG